MFLISANHVEELEKVSQEKEKLNLDHEKTKSHLEQRLENMENQLFTANGNIKELEANSIVKQEGTVIPRFTRFFDLVQKNLHNTVL